MHKLVLTVVSRVLRIIAFAIGYFVAGRLGLLLSIPPGYATVVWPASGVAITGVLVCGYELWVAAFLGSFAVNVATTFDVSTASTTFWSVLLASLIAAGASLQAILGAYLVRKYVGFPGPFGTPKGVIVALALAGPISCVTSATIGVVTLYSLGHLAFSSASVNWLTWWSGDAIGVLIAMPLLQVATAPQSTERARRVAWVAIPLTLAILGTVLLHLQVKSYDQARVQVRFHRKAAEIENAFRRSLHEVLERLYSTSAAMDVAHGVLSRDEFARVVHRFVDSQGVISNLSWNLRVLRGDRASYEQSVRDEGFANFSITELADNGEVAPAGDRPEYFVVHFLEPMRAENRRVHGFDTASEVVRRKALLASRDSGRVASTGPISLIQKYGPEKGLVVFLPQYRGSQPDDIAGRRSQWVGALVAVARLPKLVADATRGFDTSQFHLLLEDTTDGQSELLFPSPDELAGAVAGNTRTADTCKYDGDLEFGGRKWHFTCRPTEAYRSEHESLAAWGVLAAGLVLASGFGVFLLVATGRTAVVEELVANQLTEIREAKAAAEAASHAKGEFLANMSHEIRTPLNVILGMTDLLLDGNQEPQDRELLSTIQDSGQHLLAVINDILDFSKIEAGKLSLEITAFSVKDCVTETLQMFRIPLLQKGLDLQSHVDANIPTLVSGDPGRLRQILLNLVGNALKFTAKGSVTLEATLRCVTTDCITIQFKVTDTGIGIPAGKIESIFNAFEQADGSTTRQFGGSGLGLSIVRRLVTMMNGRIWVESRSGRGSTFYFEVELARATSAPEQSTLPAFEHTADLPEGLSVLVADDSPPNQILVRSMLERRGLDVTVCSDGHAAIELIKANRFDLVLMDMQMPQVSGDEATMAVRKWEVGHDCQRTPILALTANAMQGDREACFASGMDGYITKPISRQTLFAEIARVLATSGTRHRDISRRDLLLERVDRNLDLLAELVAAYETHSLPLLEQIKLASRREDFDLLQKATHALRSATVMFGESELRSSLDELERTLRATSPRHDPQLVKEIPGQLTALLADLQRVLSGGAGGCIDPTSAVSL